MRVMPKRYFSLLPIKFSVKSPNFQEIPHDPSQMFPKKITKNTSMCSNDTNKILDADHY